MLLGSKVFAPNGKGWGTSRPHEIFNGGDPSGYVKKIHWRSWGGPTAIGFGLNPLFKPSGGYYRRLGKVELKAEDIGPCHGHRAYRGLRIRFPRHPGGKLGPWRLWASNLCRSY